jgi:GntR family histidine utilization transcriptional repressor
LATKQPLFKEIKDFIKQQIAEEKYLPDEKIPTEMELSKMFNTSRPTVNKALSELVLEGVVVRFPRSGTFVTHPQAQTSILDLQNIAYEIKKRGNNYSNELLCLEEVKANEQVARVLNVVKDQKIFVSKMIHKENNVPVRFDVRYIKPTIAPDYIKQDFKKMTPSEYLQKNCPVQKVENTIEATIVNENIQNYLDIKQTEPCLLISRVVISNDEVASYSKLFYPSSRYKLNSTLESSSKNFV